MLIITADDYGRTAPATDRILECFRGGSLTSASAMMFMADSERAATLARGTILEIGLHLNFTEAFTGKDVADDLRRRQARVARYLNFHRFAQALFNPMLVNDFRSSVSVQWAEFKRLYGRPPEFVNGHHHMHLCANVLGQRLLPRRARIRGTFTFKSGEKIWVNRFYRSFVTHRLRKAYITPDCLYSVEPITDTARLRRIAQEATTRNVELEVHPEQLEQQEFLLDSRFHYLLAGAELGGFGGLNGRP